MAIVPLEFENLIVQPKRGTTVHLVNILPDIMRGRLVNSAIIRDSADNISMSVLYPATAEYVD